MNYSPTDIARQYLFLRESSQNKGQRVEAVQRWSGGQSGDSWCAEFATMVLDICFQGLPPIKRLRACQDIYNQAKQCNWLVTTPKKDDLFLYINDQGLAHHVGIVTTDGGSTGIAGNTSADGTSSNGDGVYEHSILINPNHVKYIRLPKK